MAWGDVLGVFALVLFVGFMMSRAKVFMIFWAIYLIYVAVLTEFLVRNAYGGPVVIMPLDLFAAWLGIAMGLALPSSIMVWLLEYLTIDYWRKLIAWELREFHRSSLLMKVRQWRLAHMRELQEEG